VQLTINDVVFTPEPGVDYGVDFVQWADDWDKVPEGETVEAWHRGQLRWLLERSLFAMTAFVLKVPLELCTHPFWVEACIDVQNGPRDALLDIWAREHGKSTIITNALAIQEILKNPEITILIFSYTKTAALKFFNQIKTVLEASEFLKWCYPDVLYKNPQTEATKWSEDGGLFVKRKSFKKEATVEAAGLLEGMPTGGHFFLRIYDDIMVQDLVDSPDQIEKLKNAFDLSANLGTDGGWEWVIGTPYTYGDVIQLLRERVKLTGELAYHQRIKPATEGGEFNGRSVFQSEARLDRLRLNSRNFACQQCLNPMPQEIQKLKSDAMKDIDPEEIPRRLYKFMLVDPAGDDTKGKRGDSWAMSVIGVEPFRDDIGASSVYILDCVIEKQITMEAALQAAIDMYLRAGRVLQLGVEKVALSTTEIHIANALRSKGRYLSVDAGNLVILTPKGRSKIDRIDGNLVWPLNAGKIHISTAVPAATRDRLRLEMQRYPVWKDDGIDMLAYLYDVIKDYKFGPRPPDDKPQEKKWLKKLRYKDQHRTWMVV
jgi:hypothetical protein